MLRRASYILTSAIAFGFICTGAVYAQPNVPGEDAKVSKTNEGKGTPEVADPNTSTTEEVVEGSLNLDGSVEPPDDPAKDLPADARFDDISKPQQDVTSNKGKGTPEIDEFEADRAQHMDRLNFHKERRYKMDAGKDADVGDKAIESKTNQGKGTGEGVGSWYDADREWRGSDEYWRETDRYWRGQDTEDAADYWKSSDAYWRDSDAYWTDSGDWMERDMDSRTNQGKGTPSPQ